MSARTNRNRFLFNLQPRRSSLSSNTKSFVIAHEILTQTISLIVCLINNSCNVSSSRFKIFVYLKLWILILQHRSFALFSLKSGSNLTFPDVRIILIFVNFTNFSLQFSLLKIESNWTHYLRFCFWIIVFFFRNFVC